MSAAVIRTEGLTRSFEMGSTTVHALRGIDLTIERGEYVAIMGPSGSGKSTLMNLIGCLDTPTGGDYMLNGTSVAQLAEHQLARIRNREIGFVFQSFNLLARATSLRNVELPLIYAGVPPRERRERAAEALRDCRPPFRARLSDVSGGVCEGALQLHRGPVSRRSRGHSCGFQILGCGRAAARS